MRDKLGQAGLALALSSLWPVDCQACGRPFGGSAPALVVDDLEVVIAVQLMHPRCRASEWNDYTGIQTSGGAHLTHHYNVFMLPMQVGGKPEPRPAMLLNPGLEMVFMTRDPLGRWSLDIANTFISAGLRSGADGTVRVNSPVPGAVCQLARGGLTVQMLTPPGETYQAAITPEMVSAIRQAGGVFLMVTHAVHPAEVTDLRPLVPVFQGDRSVSGWVGLKP